MRGSGDSPSSGDGTVDFGRVGDWTSWSSLGVLLLLAPLTALCLVPFVFVVSEVLPGSFWLWMILYFAALPVVLIPGVEFLQVRLVCPGSRKPTPDELARLMPRWDRVLARVGKGKRRRHRLRVSNDQRINAAAGGGSLWVPTIRSWALTRGFALHPGTRNRYMMRYTRTQHRPASRQVNDHGRVSGTHRHRYGTINATLGRVNSVRRISRGARGERGLLAVRDAQSPPQTALDPDTNH